MSEKQMPKQMKRQRKDGRNDKKSAFRFGASHQL